MADFVFTRQFLYELSEFQKSTSEDDLKSLEKTLATIVRDPYLHGRVPSFYDPSFSSTEAKMSQFLLGSEPRGDAAIMASRQLRLDCAGVSLQRLCSLDRITVLSNTE